ncbi:hypothetical protein BH11BAC4_BH11BAC4_10510 [soil metagenome]
MIKKFLICFSLTLTFSLLFVNQDFAQVKQAPAKKTTTVKKATTVKKTTTVKKASTVKKALPVAKKVVKPVIQNGGTIKIRVITDSGTMVIRLYDSTPLHRDNFAKLVSEGFYDSLMFHRVIPQFMIQGGDPLSKNAPAGTMLGNGGDNLTRIPAEFKPYLFHKKGVLAAARDNNPEKASSACQFYIVEGKLWTDAELDMMESQSGKKFTPQQRGAYKEQGGTPFLDMNYTVFGEVESGMEVIHKIASVPRDQSDRPRGDVRMHIELVK